MSTDRIYQRYLAAIQDTAESLTPADLGAVRLGLRLALADAQAEQAARTGELSDIAAQAVAERAAALQQVADLEQQLLLLQTLEDRLTAWLTHHEPAIAERFEGDVNAGVFFILDLHHATRLAAESAPPAHLTVLAERIADTIAAATQPHTNGRTNGVLPTHYPPAGGETVAPPPANDSPRGRRYNLTDAELRAAIVAGIRLLAARLSRQPQMSDWNTINEELGLPTCAYMLKKLDAKWLDLLAEAATTSDKEAEADHAPATFRG